ncbi:MAG: class I SAM-dependent methyltransferase [Deltaproteobacteria bacterium]|jgi:ubiquinone/menaquinone biosynthesis C-methylase UbiE|nr:class I SAM-dependent methyltransferase [Deltaproteobacteria bacterium]OEU60198.1 MAG: hypothetical protein BAW33_03660 [Desulfobacterales bacterium C00003104]
MKHIFDFTAAREYDRWFDDPRNRFVYDLEKEIILKLLSPRPRERLLDIGCGTGNHLRIFDDMGLDVTGVDSSPYMLDIARKKMGQRAEIRRGNAEEIPFEDNSFDIATLINVLEFTDDPARVIAEASRVARERVFIGALNSFALKGIERRVKGIFKENIYNRARFFSVWGLHREARSVLGKVPVAWRTVHSFPAALRRYTGRLERWGLVQRFPFGSFIGMIITLVPTYQTRNIELRVGYAKKRRNMAAGTIRDRIEG